MGKPLHPAIVHFPVALLLVAFGLDAIHFVYPSLPAAVTSSSLLPPPEDIPRLAYLALSAGVLSAIPAALSGILEANKVVAKGGIFESNGGVRPKVKAVGAHAALCDTVILAAAWVWWKRHAAIGERQEGEGALKFMLNMDDDTARCSGALKEAAYAAEPWIVGVEGALGAMLILAADLGGALTYQWGVGLSARSVDAKKTQ
jgi:uncharacterized membrane protein